MLTEVAEGFVRQRDHSAPFAGWVPLQLLALGVVGGVAGDRCGSGHVVGARGVSYGDIDLEVWQLGNTEGPHVKDGSLGAGHLFNIDFAANIRSDLVKDFSIGVTERSMPVVPPGPRRVDGSVVAVAVELVAALGLGDADSYRM